MTEVLVLLVLALIGWGAYKMFVAPNRLAAKVKLLLPPSWIVADLETTGLDPERHEIIEIAAIRVNRDSDHHQTIQTYIKPSRRLTKKIIEITGLTDEKLATEGISPEAALIEFLEFIGNERLVFYNAPFDMAFLNKLAADNGRVISNPVSDALDMARRAWPGRKSYRLGEIAQSINSEPEKTHTALYDARLTMTVYAAAAIQLRSLA